MIFVKLHNDRYSGFCEVFRLFNVFYGYFCMYVLLFSETTQNSQNRFNLIATNCFGLIKLNGFDCECLSAQLNGYFSMI